MVTAMELWTTGGGDGGFGNGRGRGVVCRLGEIGEFFNCFFFRFEEIMLVRQEDLYLVLC